MDIHHNDTGVQRRGFLEPPSDITRPIRKGLEDGAATIDRRRDATADAVEAHVEQVNDATRDAAERVDRSGARTSDRIELSDRAQRLAAEAAEGADREPTAEEARAARVAELKAAYEAGELNTPERIDHAARRMLGGS